MRILAFFQEVKSELSQIVWPKQKEVMKLTIIVLAISLLVGVYVGGLDFAFIKLLEILIT